MVFKKIKEKVNNFDFFELGNSAVLYYLLMFAPMPLAVLLGFRFEWTEHIIDNNIPVISSMTFLYLSLGLLFFILGYRFFVVKRFIQKVPNILRREWDFQKAIWVFGVIFISSLAVKAIWIFSGGYAYLRKPTSLTSSPFYSLLGELNWLGPIAVAIAFICYFYLLKLGQRHRYRLWQFLAWFAFVSEFAYWLFSGRRFGIIIPIIIYLIVKHYIYDRSYHRVVIAVLFIFVLVLPLGNFFKNPQQMINYFRTSVNGDEVQISLSRTQQLVGTSSFGRISQNRIILAVFEKTDTFLYGETFLSFFVSLGPPRFIWKNKPLSINAYGNEFGRMYGILHPDDFQTAVAPTIIGDWYMNFGVPGIIVGMFLMGALFRAIFNYLVRAPEISLSGIMVYSLFWPSIVKGMENWTASVYAGLVKLFILLLIIHFFIKKKET